MKCFLVFVAGLEAYVFAATAAKARWIAFRGADEAGYAVSWHGVRSAAKPEYDNLALPERIGRPYTFDAIMDFFGDHRRVSK